MEYIRFPVTDYLDGTREHIMAKVRRHLAIPCPNAAPPAPPPPTPEETEGIKELLKSTSVSGVELTITFRPDLRDAYNKTTLRNMVIKYFNRYRKYGFTMVLIMEISKTGMVHYHGSIMAPPEMMEKIRRGLPRAFGRTEIKCIKYTDSWVAYCLKNEDPCAPNTSTKKLDDKVVIIYKLGKQLTLEGATE